MVSYQNVKVFTSNVTNKCFCILKQFLFLKIMHFLSHHLQSGWINQFFRKPYLFSFLTKFFQFDIYQLTSFYQWMTEMYFIMKLDSIMIVNNTIILSVWSNLKSMNLRLVKWEIRESVQNVCFCFNYCIIYYHPIHFALSAVFLTPLLMGYMVIDLMSCRLEENPKKKRKTITPFLGPTCFIA